jgi:hypothetical protein
MGSHRRSITRKIELEIFWARCGRANGTPPKSKYPPPPKSNRTPRHLETTFVPVREKQK